MRREDKKQNSDEEKKHRERLFRRLSFSGHTTKIEEKEKEIEALKLENEKLRREVQELVSVISEKVI